MLARFAPALSFNYVCKLPQEENSATRKKHEMFGINFRESGKMGTFRGKKLLRFSIIVFYGINDKFECFNEFSDMIFYLSQHFMIIRHEIAV